MASRVISNLSDCGTLQSDLNSLYDWTVLWGSSFDVKKNEVLSVLPSYLLLTDPTLLLAIHLL